MLLTYFRRKENLTKYQVCALNIFYAALCCLGMAQNINDAKVYCAPGGVLNRNLGREVRPTQQNTQPVKDTKDVNFAALSKRKCCNFLPCSRLDQALPYSKQYKQYIL